MASPFQFRKQSTLNCFPMHAHRPDGRRKGTIEMPFCGVWMFDEMGRAVEHWENVADPEALSRWLRGE
ncbi:hypothetical protein MYCTH_2123653 [Thermothelomyces thermophilus ATCC 42464]|uniref:SnoaL-like domain-containing protein n=1 Tax=Thermothelomyces thermophilus (strain ATCC 42464 / BCRC 31852 / DSM 1799) TaxID=573729 RepID=G2Q6H3_THET4|nr:uncharacterized protein MYCTH_2123653 [Thermothelomyces thermophilus ATCC 42464]AEO54745.1 hypothetical protein MYCTH_2123653 [Thermothelomyces thermophilus ATCC 42464]